MEYSETSFIPWTHGVLRFHKVSSLLARRYQFINRVTHLFSIFQISNETKANLYQFDSQAFGSIGFLLLFSTYRRQLSTEFSS